MQNDLISWQQCAGMLVGMRCMFKNLDFSTSLGIFAYWSMSQCQAATVACTPWIIGICSVILLCQSSWKNCSKLDRNACSILKAPQTHVLNYFHMCPRIPDLPAILALLIWTASRCPHEFYVMGVYLFVLFVFMFGSIAGFLCLGFSNKYFMSKIGYVFFNLDRWITCILHIKSI